jgi:hypothetical protein
MYNMWHKIRFMTRFWLSGLKLLRIAGGDWGVCGFVE